MTEKQTLETKYNEIHSKIRDLKVQNRLEIVGIITDVFRPVVDKWALSFSQHSDTNIDFKHSNGETVVDFYLRESWLYDMNPREDKKYIKDAYFSYYTTSTRSEFEYDRLEIIGELISIHRHKQQEIIDTINNCVHFRNEEIKKLQKEKYDVESQIRAIEKQESDEIMTQLKQKLMTSGLTFNKVRVDYLKNKRLYYYYIVSAVASKTNPKSVTYTVKLTTTDGHEIVEERVREININTLIKDSIEWEQMNTKENNG
jgi:hypothetical protein